jgi:predicted alpha/beta-hydrolase family hydrolase
MTALVLFPGAGASRDQSTLVAIERAIAPVTCVRADFPYRKAGRRAPDKAPVLLRAVRDEVAAVVAAGEPPTGVFLGGRSMGGRMCSMVVGDAEDPLPAAGLVLVSYPLHPPGKPDALRVEHLPRITVPCLFVHGTRDPFGTPDELQRWTSTIAAPVTHHWIEGGRHDLRGADAEVASVVKDFLSSSAASVTGPRRRRGPRG